MPAICSIADCASPSTTKRGWCSMHYNRWLRHGDPLGGSLHGHRVPTEVRFWRSVDRSAGDIACWPWLAYRDAHGYGWFGVKQSGVRRGGGAHRFAYEFMKGPIPEGMTLDHLCRNSSCVNPAHLQPVPMSTNLKRRHFYSQIARDACKHGHPATTENTGVRTNGSIYCRVCQRDAARAKRAATAPEVQRRAKGGRRLNRPIPERVFK